MHYNVTFLKLMEYVRRHGVYGPDATDEIEYGLGSFYPAPGRLAENVRWFLGDDTLIRVVSGKTYFYGWLNRNAKKLAQSGTPFLMIDALNCQEGCIEGTAGDRLIVDVAACMSSVLGAKRVFRTVGDEFIVILQDYTEAECLEGIRHLRGTMAERGVSAAVGHAYSDCYDSGFAGMQAIADKRMYEDKDRYYRETGKKRR
ncbi:MAG: hypothetical protein IKE76_16130 [Clostridia bacterium]|nr:hypothetical protein [Clostridia bacterium]